jgi:hypothetical protein
MKKLSVMLFMLLLAPAAFAQGGDDAVVRWKTIVGVITAQGVNNPVSPNIKSGTFAWSTRGGHARVNLATGTVGFDVEGLVINGSSFSGTPGPITSVTGTLVCNAGSDQEFTLDTQPVTLSALGDAKFTGKLSNGPITCENPLFLIRIFSPAGARDSGSPPARNAPLATTNNHSNLSFTQAGSEGHACVASMVNAKSLENTSFDSKVPLTV